MKRLIEITLISTILFGLAFCCLGCKEKAEAKEGNKVVFPIKEGDPIEQTHHWGWGKVPVQNDCPHCGKTSYTRFCTGCGKERGNLPFIGVYCPKCDPKGKYASRTDDVTEICSSCGSDRTWKYVYEDWQTEPNEPDDFALTYDATRGALGISLDFIPTWPDFIELDKDLVFDISNRVRDPSDQTWTFVKGTRIYFKED